jgi:hypothetical protein
MNFLVLWTVYAAFGVLFSSALFLWAVRTRQFSAEEHARRLPLDPPPTVDEPVAPLAGRMGVLGGPLAILAVGAVVLVAAAWCASVR